MAWATHLIKGTCYGLNFDEGQASEVWYSGIIHKHNFLIGAQRLLEMARHEWLALGNLETYLDVYAEVLVKVGVARANPDYNPNVEGSEPIFIDKPHLITSFDDDRPSTG
jgi:hypothetical protein